MFKKRAKSNTIPYKGYEIDPIAELDGEGNGWSCVPPEQATGFEVYPEDIDLEKVDEFFPTLEAAKAWVDDATKLKTFLICYGADNEFWLCEAEDRAHAVEQFVSAENVSADEQENRDAVNMVFLCTEVQ